MVMLVWWILSLFGVCNFGWLPVMIDAIITSVAVLAYSTTKNDDSLESFVAVPLIGIALYSFSAQFLSLSLPFWCVFISPVWFFIACLLPGGFTITNIILKSLEIMLLPMWVYIIGGLADAIILALMIWMPIDSYRNKK